MPSNRGCDIWLLEVFFFLEIFRYFNEKLSTILRNQLTPWLDNIMIHCNTRTINFLRIETKTLDEKMLS